MNTTSLTEAWKRLRDDLLAKYPELTDDPEALADTLDGITGAKDAVARLIRGAMEDGAMATGLKDYIDLLKSRLDRLDSRADARRTAAFSMLQEMGEKKVERPEFVASITTGTPAVVITDIEAVPASLKVTHISPVRDLIRRRLLAGEAVPGAVLSNAQPYLRVSSR